MINDNQPFLVLDAGGGTIDISVYSKEGNKLRQVEASSGGLVLIFTTIY